MCDPSDDKDVDVVIPVHNGAAFIAACLESVFAQTVRPKRVVVVDDGSTDDTVAVVESTRRRHPELILHRLERNRGASAARNAGLRLSDSPLVAFLDADDIWRPEKLEAQLSVFHNDDERVGVVHSAYFLIDEHSVPIVGEFVHEPELRGDVLNAILFDDYVLSGSASSVLVKREVLERAGGFDEALYHAEDWDLWARLAAISHIDFTPKPVVGVRVHAGSAQRREQRGRAVAFFFQRLHAYNRWETEYRKHPEFVARLRSQVFELVLGDRLRGLIGADRLFSRLRSSDLVLARTLFSNRLDFWTGLLAYAVRRVVYKAIVLRRKLMFWAPPKGNNARA